MTSDQWRNFFMFWMLLALMGSCSALEDIAKYDKKMYQLEKQRYSQQVVIKGE